MAPGYTQVLSTTTYSPQTGFWFDPSAQVTAGQRSGGDALSGDLITSDKPFLFLVAVPEGNYNVKVTLGTGSTASTMTVKAEQRRLMLQGIQIAPGQVETRTFTVNVHTAKILGSSRSVGLKASEKGPPLAANWDEKLTLEFNGTNPSVAALEITPAICNGKHNYICFGTGQRGG